MVIVETPVFTKRVHAILSDEEYRLLQMQLLNKPDAGKIIKGSGGLSKSRWFAKGHGKNRGVRISISDSLHRTPSCSFLPTRRTSAMI
jgi:hypothetical protein